METVGTPALWLGFVAFVGTLLALDLGVFHKQAHKVSAKEALAWSAVWLGLAAAFAGFVYWRFGGDQALAFTTGYLLEKALAMDNVFVIAIIFSYFGVPERLQHRVLFWGIFGALIMRAAFILAGGALLARFHALLYVFGALLLITGVKLFIQRGETYAPEKNPILRLLRRFLPVTDGYREHHFVVREAGKRLVTPLLLALVVVEATDVVFALDSIPAIFAVTTDPFIVFTSNIFAILGLRSLYFLLAGAVERFHYLKPALAAVLVFVGVKMLIVDLVHIPVLASLAAVVVLLGGGVALSLARPVATPASK